MSAVADVVAYLVDEGVAGGSTGWPIFRRRLNDTSDRQIVVTEDGGLPPLIRPEEGLGSSSHRDVAVLVTVRGEQWDSDSTEAKASEIFSELHGLLAVTLGGTEYLRVAAQTASPVFAGFDETGRPVHTIGFRLATAAY
jgi:hypothetical protein